MEFYIIKQDDEIEGSASIDELPDDMDALEWMQGKRMPTLKSEVLLNLSLESGVDNLQKLPAIIKSDVDETIWENYFAVNVLGLIKGADLSKSEYNEIFPENYSFKKLAIDVSSIKDTLLFRLQESPSTLIMHRSVGKHIMDNDPDELIKGWDVYDIIQ